nr:hypothetical protein [Tanacetum cinerariifolium]
EENVGQSSSGPTACESGPDVSFASLLRGEPKRKGLNFRTLITQARNGADVAVRLESTRVVSERYANSAYGFFLGNRVAYSVVASHDSMLENGLWFICNNPLILKKWNPDVNLMKKDVVNILVWVKLHGVLVTTFMEDGLSAIATKIGTPLMLYSYTSDMCIKSWGRSSYARALIEIRADVESKDTIVVAMPKLTGEGFYTCTIHVEYEWKPPRCVCCKVFGHIQDECLKNPGLAMANNLKKPIQAPRGVQVGSKVGFKPKKSICLLLKSLLPTPTYQRGGSNLASNEADSSGTSFWNVETSSTSTTPIVDKTGKLENLIIKGKVTLVDDDGKSLKKVDYPGEHDTDDEVCSVDNYMACSMATETVVFDTKSLLEQWMDSYKNGDYDEDPYDDDMCEGQDLSDKLQDICNNLDIRVRNRRKK